MQFASRYSVEMFYLKFGFLLVLGSISNCLCQDENRVEEADKDPGQVVVGRKEKKFARPDPGWKASAFLTFDTPDEGAKGIVSFHQWGPNNIIRVTINATGLPAGKHAAHIHAFGDISQGCNSTGPHMHSNFIGNIEVKENGTIDTSFFAPVLTMFGYHGIVGRSIVIHEKPIEVHLQPEIFSTPYQFLPPNAISFQTEESQVGTAIACGPITVMENQP